MILGISFDTPEANKAFREKYEFPFRLLCDVDHEVGHAYHAARPEDPFARRISYLIDPDGRIARSYKVDDAAAHAAVVLADLRELQSG
jgi:peroxiredoxin Q/BCP